MPGYKALSELQSLFPRGLSKARSEASFESLPRMGSRRVRKGSAKKGHSTGSDEDRTPVNRRMVAEKANADIHLGRRAAPRRKVTRGSPTKEEPRDRRASLPSDEERKSALAVPFFLLFFLQGLVNAGSQSLLTKLNNESCPSGAAQLGQGEDIQV
jgi:hypothetical protein